MTETAVIGPIAPAEGGIYRPKRSRYMGLYEYTAPQRQGKNTLMQYDVEEKLLRDGGFKPEDVFCNYSMYIDGVNCMDTEHLIKRVFLMKVRKERHKVIIFDETGQFVVARESMKKWQIEFVLFCWQMPKLDIVLMYSDNPGNSADVIMRLATQVTLLPRYFHGLTRADDYIILDVIWNHDCQYEIGRRIDGVARWQGHFNTEEPVVWGDGIRA